MNTRSIFFVLCVVTTIVVASSPSSAQTGVRTQTNVDVNAQARADADRSRYRHHNGYWWYHTGDGGWIFYRNGSWYVTRGNFFSQGGGGARIDAGNLLPGLDSNIRGNVRDTLQGGGVIPGGGIDIGGGLLDR
jgi:hypothetical protein